VVYFYVAYEEICDHMGQFEIYHLKSEYDLIIWNLRVQKKSKH